MKTEIDYGKEIIQAKKGIELCVGFILGDIKENTFKTAKKQMKKLPSS